MTSRRPEVGAVPIPTGWEHIDGRLLCLACIRKETGEGGPLKMAAGRRQRSADALRDQREEREATIRAALAARAPAQGGGPIADVAAETGISEGTVREIRKAMRAAGELPPADKKRPPQKPSASGPSDTERAMDALGADSDKLDSEIALSIGVAPTTVAYARKRLGLPASREVKARKTREVVAAALAERGSATTQEISDAVGRSFPTAKSILDDLVTQGRATVESSGWGKGRATRYRAVD